MKYKDNRKFIEVYIYVPQIVIIGKVLTKLLKKIKRCSFLPHMVDIQRN